MLAYPGYSFAPRHDWIPMRPSAQVLTALLLLSHVCLLGPGAQAAEHDPQRAAQELRRLLPQVQVAVDHHRGVARHIAATNGFLTGPAGMGKAVAQVAAQAAAGGDHGAVRGFIAAWPDLFGGGAEILDDSGLVRDDTTAHSGLRTRVWQQRLHGIPVHRALLVARSTAREELVAIGSAFVPRLSQSAAKLAARDAQPAAPHHSAETALAAALRAAGLGTDGIVIVAGPVEAIQAQRLRAQAAIGEISAQLTWFATADDLRLAWSFTLVERPQSLMYTVLVDTTSLKVLERIRLTSEGFAKPEQLRKAQEEAPLANHATTPISASASLATTVALRVYTSDSPMPMTPGFGSPTSTQPPEVARTLETLTSIDATASPDGWIDANNQTRGNNVFAHLDVDDNDIADLPRPAGSGTSPVTFDFPLDLTQAPSAYRNAAVVNLFYWCNVAHDRLYQLGFTETAGNFQLNNFGRGGSGGDAVQADAQDGSGTDNANFSSPVDGNAPRMQMFIFTGPTPDRDSSLDATVILHEYVHGLTSRLVGGGGLGILDTIQSAGMGEGWSDFYALALLSAPGDDPLGTYTTGSYVTRNYFSGIRSYPYAVEPAAVVTGTSLNPQTFNDIIGEDSVHDIGEVWCQALWECRGELISKHGAAAGNTLMLELVTDGLKLTPAAPTFAGQSKFPAGAGCHPASRPGTDRRRQPGRVVARVRQARAGIRGVRGTQQFEYGGDRILRGLATAACIQCRRHDRSRCTRWTVRRQRQFHPAQPGHGERSMERQRQPFVAEPVIHQRHLERRSEHHRQREPHRQRERLVGWHLSRHHRFHRHRRRSDGDAAGAAVGARQLYHHQWSRVLGRSVLAWHRGARRRGFRRRRR